MYEHHCQSSFGEWNIKQQRLCCKQQKFNLLLSSSRDVWVTLVVTRPNCCELVSEESFNAETHITWHWQLT